MWGIDVVLVSSGSVAEGMSRLGLPQRPEALYELQAVAAVGQMGLVQAYESCFQRHATHTAQVLLTHEDFSDRGDTSMRAARFVSFCATAWCP